MKNTIVLLFLILIIPSFYGQELQEGQKRWSEENRLKIEDYKVKISAEDNIPIYSQFIISHEIRSFDFFKKNFNQKISNIFVGNASWVDTTYVSKFVRQLEYQQIQFDISEIYTREFRKRILLNRRKIARGFTIIKKINNEILSELTSEWLMLAKETRLGRDLEAIKRWKAKIKKRLALLWVFRYENKKKIKISKSKS